MGMKAREASVPFWSQSPDALFHALDDGVITVVIVCGSALLSFWQGARASKAAEALRCRLALTSRVVRRGTEITVPAAELVPGDIILCRPFRLRC